MSSRRGFQRERDVVLALRADGWFAVRFPASKGPCDILALKAGERVRLIECKSTKAGPYHSFGPADREELRSVADRAGGVAELAYWPPWGKLRFIPADEWPL